MMVVCKPRIIRQKKEEVKVLEQIVTEVHKTYVQVVSRKGKKYHVNLSDKVRMTKMPVVGEKVIIKTFPTGWLVTDVVKEIDCVDEQYICVDGCSCRTNELFDISNDEHICTHTWCVDRN